MQNAWGDYAMREDFSTWTPRRNWITEDELGTCIK